MGSAITAIRQTDSRPGVLDGSPIGGSFRSDGRGASIGAGVGRIGQTVPGDPRSLEASSRQSQPKAPQEEVVLQQLWFRLSREDRARFGGCFCQMVLRALGRQRGKGEGDEP